MEIKTKVIKVVFYPWNTGRVQIDTIAILGFQVGQLNLTGQCPGNKEVSASAIGATPENQVSSTRTVTCSGNGVCGVTGCECKGNWEGQACDRCQFGWTGETCTEKVKMPDMQGLELLRIVMFEDLNDFNFDELQLRWSISDYVFRTSRVFSSRHFGVKFVSPQITLGEHTHVRCQAGFFVIDMPNHQDSGIMVRYADKKSLFPDRDRTPQERIDDHERIGFTKHIPYVTGINVMSTLKGDTSEQMDITVGWEYDDISFEFEIWSPDIREKADKGDHRFTLTYFAVHSANYPSSRGSASPDADSLN
jgi:hypothetical protein